MLDEPNQSAVEEFPAVTPPGLLLMQARERLGFTREQVAEALHMTVGRVRSIESDDYVKLNTDTFTRGYLRCYAKFLKLDTASIISAYEQHKKSLGMESGVYCPIPKETNSKKLWGFVVLLAALLAGLWLISVWFFGNQVDQPTAVSPSPAPLSAAPIEPPVEPVSSVSDVVASDAEVVAEPDNQQLDNVSASVVEAPAKPVLDQLYLSFADECWVEVSDIQGDVLVTELQRPGSTLTLSGIAPFSVKLGNAAVVELRLNGEPVPIELTSGNKVVSLSVGN